MFCEDEQYIEELSIGKIFNSKNKKILYLMETRMTSTNKPKYTISSLFFFFNKVTNIILLIELKIHKEEDDAHLSGTLRV